MSIKKRLLTMSNEITKKEKKKQYYREIKTVEEFASIEFFEPLFGMYRDADSNSIQESYGSEPFADKCKSSMPMYIKLHSSILYGLKYNTYLNVQKINGKYDDVVYQICDEGELKNYLLIEIKTYNCKMMILASKYDYDNIYQETK